MPANMAFDSSNGLPPDLAHGDNNHPTSDAADKSWQSAGRQTPDNDHKLRLTNSNPGPASLPGSLPAEPPWNDEPPRKSSERNRSRQRNGRSASGQIRTCKKCGEPLTGQFVRALDGTFHLDCFKCRVCWPPVSPHPLVPTAAIYVPLPSATATARQLICHV